MKKAALAILVGIFLMGCKSTETSVTAEVEPGQEREVKIEVEIETVKFSNVSDKDWKLIEVYINGSITRYDRSSLSGSGFTDLFTLRFDAEFIGGRGAPNRYNAPYTAGEDRAITIELVRANQMAMIEEPLTLREYDYFRYLQGAYSWDITDEKLEINSSYNNNEIRLVFSL